MSVVEWRPSQTERGNAMPTLWTILPDPEKSHLIQLIPTATIITVVVETVSTTTECPVCGRFSHRVHSQYLRLVADVP